MTLFRFSCNFFDSEEQNSNLEQDFKSESIELFRALQKNTKNTKIKKNNFVKFRPLFSTFIIHIDLLESTGHAGLQKLIYRFMKVNKTHTFTKINMR